MLKWVSNESRWMISSILKKNVCLYSRLLIDHAIMHQQHSTIVFFFFFFGGGGILKNFQKVIDVVHVFNTGWLSGLEMPV